MSFSVLAVVLVAFSVVHTAPQDYSFSYDTGTGGYHQQQASAGGGVAGKYGFSGEGGSSVMVSYSAPSGEAGQDKSFQQPQQASWPSPANGAQSQSSGTYNLNLSPGGVYSYDYQLSDQSKYESRGADGKVMGRYSYKGTDGQQKSLSYTADEGGFQPQGDSVEGRGNQVPAQAPPQTSPAPPAPPKPSAYHGGASGGNVQGQYSVEGTGASQKTSYKSGAEGYHPIHSITINFSQ